MECRAGATDRNLLSRTLGAVLSYEQQLSFWNMPGLTPIHKPSREELQLPPGTATLLPAAWLRGGSVGRLFLLDTQGHLAFWVVETGKSPTLPATGKTHRLADRVLGLAKVDKDVVAYVQNDGGRLYAHSVGADGIGSRAHVLGVAEGVSQVLFAASPLWRRSFGGCALLSVDNGSESWRVISATGRPVQMERIDLASRWKGLGLLLQEGDDHYSLVLLSPNQQIIALYCEGQQRVLFTTSHAISRVSFCPMSGLVAALTSARELLVYSVPMRTMRLQVFCNQIPEKHKEGADGLGTTQH